MNCPTLSVNLKTKTPRDQKDWKDLVVQLLTPLKCK